MLKDLLKGLLSAISGLFCLLFLRDLNFLSLFMCIDLNVDMDVNACRDQKRVSDKLELEL